jgi:peptidoglycan/LPS O-acetylase OafA/YrhL
MTSNLLSPLGGDLIAAMSYFFILSGFILVISTANEGYLPDTINRVNFWKRRAARILPMYLFAILVFFAINFRYDPEISLFAQTQSYFHSIFLLQSWRYKMALDVNFPAWSLSVEAFFYFIFPWVYSKLRNLSNKKLLIWSAIAWAANFFAVYLLKLENAPEGFVKFYPLLHVATFLTGMSFGILFVRNYNWLKNVARKYIHSATIVATLILIFTAYNDYFFHEYQDNGLLSPYYLLIIFSLSLINGKIGKVLSSKPLIFLGSISYSIYILQCPIHQLCQNYLPWFKDQSSEDLFFPYVIVLIIVSSLTYLLIEMPARKYFTRRKVVE